MAEKSVHLRITGNVQGVGYRAWMVRAAASLGVRGWVRNRTDGSVEAMAAGEAQRIDALVEACRRGPRAALVEAVTVEPAAEIPDPPGFSALPTV